MARSSMIAQCRNVDLNTSAGSSSLFCLARPLRTEEVVLFCGPRGDLRRKFQSATFNIERIEESTPRVPFHLACNSAKIPQLIRRNDVLLSRNRPDGKEAGSAENGCESGFLIATDGTRRVS